MNKEIYKYGSLEYKMKKVIISIVLIFFALPGICKVSEDKKPNAEKLTTVIEGGVTFDWITKTQIERDENIEKIRNVIFNENTVFKYSKNDFKEKYSQYFKNKNFLTDYEEVLNGKTEDNEKYYCGFYWKKILVAYGIQFKNNPHHVFYYDCMGNLRWIDSFSENYPNFPYWAYQYDKSGKLAAAFYFVSSYDQYAYSERKKFRGRWYKDKLYNRRAKVVMTRSNY